MKPVLRKIEDPSSVAALVLGNLIPVGGVLLLDWNAAHIVLLYWAENLIAGFYGILKLALIPAPRPLHHLAKLFLIPFFSLHYGGFCAVHGLFLLIFFRLGEGMQWASPHRAWPGPFVFLQLLISVIGQAWRTMPPEMIWPLLGLAASHGVSFVENHILHGEYSDLAVRDLMTRPYRRIVILHVAVIAGGIPVMMLESPLPLLLLLIALKIGFDIHLHARTHRADRARAPGPGSARSKRPKSDHR